MCAKSQFYSRTKHLLLSAYGRHWRDVLLAMFTVYLDDSGTDPNQSVAIATALIIPASRIVALDKEWQTLATKENFEHFHTAPCLAGNKKEGFGDWDEAKKFRVLRRARQIGKKFGLTAISLSVKKADYDAVIPQEFRELAGRHHYTWAIRNVLGMLDGWADFTNFTGSYEYVYGWMDPKAQKQPREEIVTVMEQADEMAQRRGSKRVYSNYSFRHNQEIPALQCTDAIAWTCYQFSLRILTGLPLSEIAAESVHDYHSHPRKDWLLATTIERENLKDWVERETKDGKGIERLRTWAEEHRRAPKSKRV